MIRKDIKMKMKNHFFLNPTVKLRVRQIEREIKIPLPSVIRYTKELEEEGILKSDIIANIKLYSADRTSKHFLLEKKLFNIKYLVSSGLVDYIINKLSNPGIIVYGSFSKGEDTEESDIDLYLESPSKKEINFKMFEKKIQRKVQVFIYKNIHDIENKNLANNIINGITLNGFIEVFK